MTDVWTAVVLARLSVKESGARSLLGRDVPGWHSWPNVRAMCEQALRQVAAMRAIMAEHQMSDWAPYGEHVCSRCKLRDDEPIPDGHHWVTWPCPTVRALAGIWSGHADYPGRHDHSVV